MFDNQTPEHSVKSNVRAFFGLIAFVVLPTAFVLLLENGMGIGKAYGFYLLMCALAFVAIGILTWLTLFAMRKRPDLCVSPPPLKNEWAILAGSIAIVGSLIMGILWGFKWFCITFWPLGFMAMFCIHIVNWAIHQLKYRKLI